MARALVFWKLEYHAEERGGAEHVGCARYPEMVEVAQVAEHFRAVDVTDVVGRSVFLFLEKGVAIDSGICDLAIYVFVPAFFVEGGNGNAGEGVDGVHLSGGVRV